jgi:hypothetical protein
MKKLFFFFSLIITISASAQTYPWISIHNYQRHDGLWPSRLLALPSDTVTNKQIGSIAYLDGVTYIKNLFSWDPLALSGTGGGGDGAGPLTLQNVINNGNQFDRNNILRGNGYDLFIDSIDNFTINANGFYVPSLRSGESTNQFLTTDGFGGFKLQSIEFPVDTSGFAGTQDLQSTIDYGNRFRHNNTIHAIGHDFYIDSLGNYSTFSGHTATFDNQTGAYTEIHQDSANAYLYSQSPTGLNISEVRTHQDSAHFQSYDSVGNNARFTAYGKGTLNSYASVADSMNSPKIVFGDVNYKNTDTSKILATNSVGDMVFKTLYNNNPALPCYGVLQPGYVTGSGSGLTVNVTAAIYRINCVTYNSAAGSVTLSTADATNPRYDVIAVDNTGSIVVITGTASANPSIPQVDPATQIELTSIFVDAGATSLPITDQVIYDENTEAWTGTATGVTANFTNTLNVQHGTKSADVGSWTTGQQINFTKNSGTITATDYSVLTFYVKLKVALASTANIRVSFLNGTTVVSSVVTLASAQGFTKTSTAYQTIAIPLSAFTVTSTVNKVRITLVGTGGGLYLDYLRLQSGVVTTPTETDPVANAKTVSTHPGYGIIIPETVSQTISSNPSHTPTVDTFAISTRAWRQKLADSLGAIIGTKQASLTGSQGDMIYFSATNALASLAKSTTAHQFISSDGTSNNPLYETINSDWITQGSTNKFYTDALARAAISLTTTGTSGASTYNSSTGVLNIPQYSGGGATGAWLLASGGTLTGTNNVTSNAANQLIFDGTYTTTANNQWHFNYNPTITARGTASDVFIGQRISPTFIYGANSQEAITLDIEPTYTVGAFTSLKKTAIKSGGDIVPVLDGTYNLGSSTSNSWASVFGGFITANTRVTTPVLGSTNTAISFRGPSGNTAAYFVNTTDLVLNPKLNTATDANYRLDAFGEIRSQGVNVTQLGAPSFTVTQQGTAGSTSYTYLVQGVLINGSTTPIATVTTSTGNAALGATNFNRITVTLQAGVDHYNVYRSASSGSPGTTGGINTFTVNFSSGGTTIDDKALTASGSVPTNTTDMTGYVSAFYYKYQPYTSAQITAMTGMAAGDAVYCSDCTANDASTGVLEVYNGSAWKKSW